MRRIVAFLLESGGTILAEVDDSELSGATTRSLRPGEVAEQAQVTFEGALKTIRVAVEVISGELRALSNPPNHVGVEFGIKLSGKANAIITSAAVEATFKVSLSWMRGPQYEAVLDSC